MPKAISKSQSQKQSIGKLAAGHRSYFQSGATRPVEWRENRLNAIVGENVCNRERELALCNRILGTRASALIEKLCFEEKRRHRAEVPLHAGWISQPAALVRG